MQEKYHDICASPFPPEKESIMINHLSLRLEDTNTNISILKSTTYVRFFLAPTGLMITIIKYSLYPSLLHMIVMSCVYFFLTSILLVLQFI